MRAHIVVGLFGLGLAVAGPVSAGASTLQAVLAAPAVKAVTVLDGRVWRCAGQVCSAGGEGRSQSLFRECARVARTLGQLTAYSRDGQSVDEATLMACNRG